MPRLIELARKYQTDKAFFYAEFYEQLLEGLEVRRLLEIGIGSPETMNQSISRAGWTDYKPGASLRMWAEYYPNAWIYGADHDRSLLFEEGRIRTLWLNQANSFTYPHYGNYDLIIDDGSHEREHQLLARSILLPLVRTGGIYITEDITNPDTWPYPCERFNNEYGKAAISWVRK